MMIINAMRMAQDYQFQCKIFWPITDQSRPEVRNPEEIFSQDFIARHFIDHDTFKIQSHQFASFETLLQEKSQNQLADFMDQHAGVIIDNTSRSRYVMPWEQPAHVATRIAQVFREIDWHETITQSINSILDALGPQSPTAYHIRRGDITNAQTVASNKLWPTKYFPREFYEAHLADHTERGGGKILIFTDEPREVAKLQSVSDLAMEIDDIVDRDQLSWCQYDFLSLFAMSLCQPIYGPSGSGFSETAAVIGNTGVLDISKELAPELRNTALDTLVDRLESTPENFFSDADIGQNFPFAYAHLSQKNAGQRGADIIRSYLDRGMDRAYAYQMLSAHHLANAQFEQAVALLEEARAQKNVTDLTMAAVQLNTALAYDQRGDSTRAADLVAKSFWLHPKSRQVEAPVIELINRGELNDQNFYPIDRNLSRPANIRTPTGKMKGIAFPVDPIVRDWKLLLGKRVGQKFMRPEFINLREARVLQNFKKSSTNPAVMSIRGLYDLERGNFARAEQLHHKALSKDPDQPIYWKRYSDALFKQDGKQEAAINAMETAVEKSGAQICYVALLAHYYAQNKQRDRSNTLWRQHLHKATPYPEINYLAAQHLSWDPEGHDLAAKHMDIVLGHSHETKRFLNVASHLFYRIGQPARSLSILEEIEAMGALNPITTERLASLRAELT
ncbi:hypothetical protein GCM10007939_01280 [Amylibacter marinus]|uniref:Tetratricopeptide repeat-containing protein n=1 Tax=Amylibacter marinus TaxID=1475483 RepID=A0ABQ5VR01_9RHOB|nr:hypothetical protein [Amylibacter marinus]GLQ33845.1 hypothetical protein GCM10007939_01280 [Amylibacter marinus]